MIFKRVKDRAATLETEVNNSYTSDIQNDLMDIARSSFEAKRNPFTQIAKTETKNATLTITVSCGDVTKTATVELSACAAIGGIIVNTIKIAHNKESILFIISSNYLPLTRSI